MPSDLGVRLCSVQLAGRGDSRIDLQLPLQGRVVITLTSSSLLVKVPSEFVWLLGWFVCLSVVFGFFFCFVISPVCCCIPALLFDTCPSCAVAHCKDSAGWAVLLFSLLSTCVCASVPYELCLCIYIYLYTC